jgi:hypothetical protein
MCPTAPDLSYLTDGIAFSFSLRRRRSQCRRLMTGVTPSSVRSWASTDGRVSAEGPTVICQGPVGVSVHDAMFEDRKVNPRHRDLVTAAANAAGR